MDHIDQLFTRHPANPILTAGSWPYPVNTVFNAGAAMYNGETLLLVRVEDRSGASHLAVARSEDGVGHWRVDPQPALTPSPIHPEEQWGIEDPRITWLEELETYGVTYTAYSPDGPLVALATTSDFKRWDRLGPVLPVENKDAALLPSRIGGRWAMIHRPVPGMSNSAHAWLSFSPDLRHWGDHRPVLRARSGPYWDAGKVGLSAQPLWTEHGWLLLYHGVKRTISGCIYRQGLALLQLDDPRQVLARTGEWVFSPVEPYERQGDVGNVVFCCGWLLKDGEIRMYYGGADTCMALATAPLDRVLAAMDSLQ